MNGQKDDTPSRSGRRFPGFDYLRVAGIAAVIYIHGCDTNQLLRQGMKWLIFAVPCFFMMSVFLTQLSVLRNTRTYFEWVRTKFTRLAPAFYFWSVIYLIVRWAKSAVTGSPLETTAIGVVFWGDASYQLYFVPMLFYGFAACIGTMQLARSYPWCTSVVLAVAIACCAMIDFKYRDWLPPNRWFVTRNLIWFPTAMLGSLILSRFDSVRTRLRLPAAIVLIGTILANFPSVYLVSVCVFAIALSIERESPIWMKTLATYSYGVYLNHVLFIEAFQFAAPKVGVDVSRPSVTIFMIFATTVLSFGVCLLLGQSAKTRWCVT